MEDVLSHLDIFVAGMRTTAALTLVSYAGALVLGTFMAAARISPVPPLRWAGTAYVELLRSTPLVALMFIFYFGLPDLGFRLSEFNTAMLALALYTSSFVAETVRAGINAVPVGQAEAARSLGFTFSTTLTTVVLPQALRTMVPPLASLFIALIKNSSVAYTISVLDLTGQASRLGTEIAQSANALLVAAVAYLVLTVPSGLALGVLERRVAVKR